MCSLVLFLTRPMMMAGFAPLAFTYSLNRSLFVRSAIILSAIILESESFHRPLRSYSVDGSMRVTLRAHETNTVTKNTNVSVRISNAFKFTNRFLRMIRTKHKISGHEHTCARLHQVFGICLVHTAIDLDQHFCIFLCNHCRQVADLVVSVLYKLLSSEARIHRHHANHIDVVDDLRQHRHRSMRVESHAGLCTGSFNLLYGPVKMNTCLGMH